MERIPTCAGRQYSHAPLVVPFDSYEGMVRWVVDKMYKADTLPVNQVGLGVRRKKKSASRRPKMTTKVPPQGIFEDNDDVQQGKRKKNQVIEGSNDTLLPSEVSSEQTVAPPPNPHMQKARADLKITCQNVPTQLAHPFRMVVSGPSQFGKTTIVCKLLKYRLSMIQPPVQQVLWYSGNQHSADSAKSALD